VEGRNHPPPPLEATRAPRGQQQPAAAVWPTAYRGVGAGRGAPWTWSGQRNNAGVPTETYLAFPTTELSGKRALASGRRLSEFSQVSRRARTFSSKTISQRVPFRMREDGSVLARAKKSLKSPVPIAEGTSRRTPASDSFLRSRY